MLYATLGLAVMVACGLVLGWRWHTGPAEVAAAIGLLLLLRFAVLWAGMWMGLVFTGAAALAIVQTVMFPFTMVTNTFAPTETMPVWLGTLAEWNPLSATVTATRELFGNPGVGGDSFVARNAIQLAVAVAGRDHRGLPAARGPPLPEPVALIRRLAERRGRSRRWALSCGGVRGRPAAA